MRPTEQRLVSNALGSLPPRALSLPKGSVSPPIRQSCLNGASAILAFGYSPKA